MNSEHRAQHGRGEDPQQQAGRAVSGGAVQQDAARLQFRHRLVVAGQGRPAFQYTSLGGGTVAHPAMPSLSTTSSKQVVADQRDVLMPRR